MTRAQELIIEIRSHGYNNVKIAYLVGILRSKEVPRKHVTEWSQGTEPMKANMDALEEIARDLREGRLHKL